MWLVLIALAGLIIVQGEKLFRDPALWPPDDFVEYYSAGQLNAQGRNPYDADLLLPIQQAAASSWPTEAVMMWNPPWTLPFIMPLGSIPPRLSLFIFLMLSLACILVSVDGTWREYGGNPKYRLLVCVVALFFLPTMFVLRAGQISAFLLLGAYLFLHWYRRGWYFMAGAITILMAIKPHLFAFVWLAMLWDGRWRVWVGGIVTGLVCMAIALAANPEVWHQYREAMTLRPPAQWQSPTFGAVLRMAFGVQHFSLQFLSLIPGMIWFLWRYRLPWHSMNWLREMPPLMLVSFATAVYGAWVFDMVLLLLPVTALAARTPQIRSFLIFFVLFNLVVLVLNQLQVNQFWFMWVAPVWCIVYVWLAPREDRMLAPVG